MAEKSSKPQLSLLLPIKQILTLAEQPTSTSRNSRSDFSPSYFCTCTNFQSAAIYLSQVRKYFQISIYIFIISYSVSINLPTNNIQIWNFGCHII